MDATGIDRMLSQLRTAQALASRKPEARLGVPEAGATKADFSTMLKDSLNQVAKTQNDAVTLSKAFSVGDPNTNLQDVMIAMQKSTISFQQAIQVRNKLVQAYQEVMNLAV
jgi:flagellar hook-basal body complex protein FliE